MANAMAKSVLLIVFLGLFYLSTAAPVPDVEEETGVEQNVNTETDQDIITDTETVELSTTEETPSSDLSDDDVNKEVTNYHSIEIDGNSKLEAPDAIEENDGTVLSEKDAQELLLELSDPSDVAQFIVASDDARGFLEALRLLTDQDYISLKMAYYIRDRVMDELRRMLMIQEIELSRTLLNNYDDLTSQEQLPNSEPPAPYYDDEFNTYVTQDDFYPQVPYELYEESLRQENSRALAEIAEAVAQKIATGELTSENGVKIMNTVASLLPDSYWQDALEVFSDNLPLDDSDYSQDSIGSDVLELLDNVEEDEEDEEENSAEVEDESDEEVDLETELRNRHMENVLEKQLVHKAQIKEENTQSEEEGITNFDNTIINEPDLPAVVEIGEPELTEEDYQAFFDWLENAVLDMPGQEGADQEPILVKDDDDDKSSSGERSAETNES